MSVTVHNVRVSNPEACSATVNEMIESHKIGRQITLLHDQVLIRLLPPSAKIGRFYAPDSAHQPATELHRGIVIATGPGKRSPKTGCLTPCDVVHGDIVVYYHVEIMYDEVIWPSLEYRIMSEDLIRYVEVS